MKWKRELVTIRNRFGRHEPEPDMDSAHTAHEFHSHGTTAANAGEKGPSSSIPRLLL
jgi:hypothetical protein